MNLNDSLQGFATQNLGIYRFELPAYTQYTGPAAGERPG